jgi:hypothetical protein
MDPAQNNENQSENLEIPEAKKPAEVLSSLHSFELYKDYTLPTWSAKPTKSYL